MLCRTPPHAGRALLPVGLARAFSLIEVMIAASILAVGATAVLSAFRMTEGMIEHQRRLSAAVNVSQSKLETLLAADAATSAALAQGAHGPDVVDVYGRLSAPGAESYSVDWTVTSGAPSTGYMLIVVQTTWTETRGIHFTKFAAYREE